MINAVSSIDEILAALPAVQAAIRDEIAQRVQNGEVIASIQNDVVSASSPATRDLATKRVELLARQGEVAQHGTAHGTEFKSIA